MLNNAQNLKDLQIYFIPLLLDISWVTLPYKMGHRIYNATISVMKFSINGSYPLNSS